MFDFDVNRTLELVSKFITTNNHERDFVGGIEKFLEYMPIYSYDSGAMEPLDVNSIIEISTSGMSSSMLTRRWSSLELVDMSIGTIDRIINDDKVMDVIGKIESFRNFDYKNMMKSIISNNSQIEKLKNSKDKNDKKEKEKLKNDNKNKKKELKQKLMKFIKNMPIFMYLTDYREENIIDVITTLDRSLFEVSTGVTVDDFNILLNAGLFNKRVLNESVSMFRRYEDSSLTYLG